MAEESGRKKRRKKAKSKKEVRREVSPEEETGEIRIAPPEEFEEGSGRLTFDPTIITEIAQREAKEIEGVAELTGSFIDGLRRGSSRGVAVTEVGEGGEDAYDLTLRLSVEYGANCVAIAETIRERVADAVKRMTGRKVRRIDINVTGIAVRREERGESPEEAGEMSEEHGIDF